MVLDFFAAIYIGSPPPALSFRCLFFSRLHACLQSTSGIQNARFSFFPLFDTAKVVKTFDTTKLFYNFLC